MLTRFSRKIAWIMFLITELLSFHEINSWASRVPSNTFVGVDDNIKTTVTKQRN